MSLNVGDKNYSYYITTIDKLPEEYRKNIPFVIAAEPYVNASKGMKTILSHYGQVMDVTISLEVEHGFGNAPKLFQITEDTHTMSYILPYVVPMLENAGAYVMLPRERDINRNEVIVDNDTNDDGYIFFSAIL